MEKDNELRVEPEAMRVGGDLIKQSYRTKIHIRLDDDLHHRLRQKVAAENTTIQNFITNLLKTALS